MPLPRKEFLNALTIAQPALATKDLIEELTCVWFLGDSLYCYNDSIGIHLPFKTDFTGGLRGSLLIGLLEKSRASEVHIEKINGGDEMLLKAANARLTLALLEDTRSMWEIPQFDKSKSFVIGKEFLDVLEHLLVSIGGDSSIPDQLGITIIAQDQDLFFYTTDSNTISTSRITRPKSYDQQRVVIDATFVEQLLKLCKEGAHLVVTENCIMAMNTKNVFLYAPIREIHNPLNFEGKINESLPPELHVVPVPSRLKLAIERVSLVLEGSIGQPARFYIDKNTLRIYAKTPLGEIKDSMRLEGNHPDIDTYLDPALVKRALNNRSHFCLTNDCMILTGPGDFIHLISASLPE